MPASHVEDRLEERVVPAVADCGFELLRSPKHLAAFIEREGGTNPAVAQAERVALPLATHANPPHLVVTKDGHGITCLAAGMAFDVPALNADRVQTYLTQQAEELRLNMAGGRYRADKKFNDATLRQVIIAPWTLDRHGFERLRMLSPLLTEFFSRAVGEQLMWMVGQVGTSKRRRPSDQEALQFWRTLVTASLALMATGLEREMLPWCLLSSGAPDVMLSSRGLWMSVNQPERTLETVESLIRGHLDAGPAERLGVASISGVAPALTGIALRFRHHAAAAVDLLKRIAKTSPDKEHLWEQSARTLDRWRAAESPGLYYWMLMCSPVLLMHVEPEGVDQYLKKIPKNSLEIVSGLYMQGERNIVALAAALHPKLAEQMLLLDPMRHLQTPIPLRPTHLNAGNPLENLRIELWRHALATCFVSPNYCEMYLGPVMTLCPVEALIPGDAPDPLMQPERGVEYVRVRLPGILSGGESPKPITRTGPQVGRNEPCPCGSGKKYKKCCDGKDSGGKPGGPHS